MTTVAFPDGYYIERSSTFEHDNNVSLDILDDGEPYPIIRGSEKWKTIDCKIPALTMARRDTLMAFLETNAANKITWTIDGIALIGHVQGKPRDSMTGSRYIVTFQYYARKV